MYDCWYIDNIYSNAQKIHNKWLYTIASTIIKIRDEQENSYEKI